MKFVWTFSVLFVLGIGNAVWWLSSWIEFDQWLQIITAPIGVVMTLGSASCLHQIRVSIKRAKLLKLSEFHLRMMEAEAYSERPDRVVYESHKEQLEACLEEMECN